MDCDNEDVKMDVKPSSLSKRQVKRIELNRQKALQLRKSRIANVLTADRAVHQKEVNVVSRPRDTGGGFLLDDGNSDEVNVNAMSISHPPAPLYSIHWSKCVKCDKEFGDSYLQQHFDVFVCDSCRNDDDVDEYTLISKTDAKKEYLLKDCDLEKREPPLKYILKKNPHNVHGSMKLYLRLQVEQRALEVHGSEEQLEDMKDQREAAQEKRKQKAFDKKVKALRMAVRSSLYRKDNSHVHEYGNEVYKKDDDMYEKTCSICGYTLSYEKM